MAVSTSANPLTMAMENCRRSGVVLDAGISVVLAMNDILLVLEHGVFTEPAGR